MRSARGVLMFAGMLALLPFPAAAEPQIENVWRNPNDVFLMRVNDGRLYAVTTGGREWSVTADTLHEAFKHRDPFLMVQGIGPKEHLWLAGREPEGEPATEEIPDSIAGYPVTAARSYGGALYLATFGGGLFRSDGKAIAGVPADVRDLEVAGDLLVAGHIEGLSLFDGRDVWPLPILGPQSDNVSSLAEGGGYLWVGYFDGGLARYREPQWETVEIPGPPKASWVNTLCWDTERLWIGTEEGLWEYHPDWGEARRVEEFEGRIQAVRGHAGSLVVTGSRWVAVRSNGVWERFDRPWDSLHTAFLWGSELQAGGMAGVLRRREGRWRRYSELTGELPHSWVTALHPGNGRLWVGTYDAGLGFLSPNGKWDSIDADLWVNPNAISRWALGVAVGTQGTGLHMFDPGGKPMYHLTRRDGLPGDDVTAILSGSRGLWVGTRSGLAYLSEEPASASRKE